LTENTRLDPSPLEPSGVSSKKVVSRNKIMWDIRFCQKLFDKGGFPHLTGADQYLNEPARFFYA